MIELTENARRELRALLERKQASPASGLRLAVRRGGCAGWQYEMKVAEPEEADEVLDADGARLIVAADSRAQLEGCRVDYHDTLSDSGFRIENPRASRACGCGTSFEARDEPAPDPSELEDCGRES